MAKTGNVDKDYFSAYLSEKAEMEPFSEVSSNNHIF